MWKRALFLAYGLTILTIGVFSYANSTGKSAQHHCPFCDEEVLNYQKFYEDDVVMALYTHKPVMPGHVLIIPKRHVERYESLTDEELMHIHYTLKKVNIAVSKVFETSAYLLLQKNGVEVGQSVPHVHFHYIPRKAEEKSDFKLLWAFYVSGMLDRLVRKRCVKQFKRWKLK